MRTVKQAVQGKKESTEMISEKEIQELIEYAIRVREKAYAPYSKFKVGAALITEDGFIFTGCNIENASYGAANCAERTAIFKAVSEGHRKIKAIAVAGGMKDSITDYTYPCGICRQVMAEFQGNKGMTVISAISREKYKTYNLSELLPEAFRNIGP